MPKFTNNPKLSDALRAVRERHGIKVETLAAGFLCSDSTVYDVLGEKRAWDELFADLRHALGTLPAPAADAVLGVLLAGTGYPVPPRGDAVRDFNGDGVEDKADIRRGLAQVAGTTAQLQEACEETGRLLTPEEAAAQLAAIDEQRRKLDGVRELVVRLTYPKAAG